MFKVGTTKAQVGTCSGEDPLRMMAVSVASFVTGKPRDFCHEERRVNKR